MIGLVTGANRGLGLELVRIGLERGYDMSACWLGYPEDDQSLLDLKEKYRQKLTIIKMDVTKENEVREAAKTFSAVYDHLDFIVNNAGVLYESKFDKYDQIKDLDIEMLRKTIDVNTVGPAVVLKHFIPFIYKSDDPCILNITSEAACLEPESYTYLAYGVSKYAANMYTQKIRNYLVSKYGKGKIRIFMIHPGRMMTKMGVENAQISPVESAEGIHLIIDKTINPELDIPFINYKGEPMPTVAI